MEEVILRASEMEDGDYDSLLTRVEALRKGVALGEEKTFTIQVRIINDLEEGEGEE